MADIPDETLEGLRDAYIAHEIQQYHPGYLIDRLSTWVEGVLEDAGMLEDVRKAVQQAYEYNRLRRAEERAEAGGYQESS